MRTDRPLALNVTEAGNLLGVSRTTAYELVRTGELESVRLRRRCVVPVAALASRLGMTVPEVWAALAPVNQHPVELNALDNPHYESTTASTSPSSRA